MSSAESLVALGDSAGQSAMSTSTMIVSIVGLLLALMIPILAITLCVMKTPTRRPDDEVGLGNVSLHDELWGLIAAVERGELTMASFDTSPGDSAQSGMT